MNVTEKDRFSFRYDLANNTNSEVFVSFHLNGGTQSDNVFAIYQQGQGNSSESIRLATAIANQLSSIMNSSSSSVVPVKGHIRFSNLAVLRNFKGKAGVLIEFGSINSESNRNFINRNYCLIGYRVASAIYEYLNSNKQPPVKYHP